jgi:hypothetical protein
MSVLDLESTLVRRGTQATTFGQMADFADRIERRALDQLVNDLPGLARLSDMKFSLARQVIRRRARSLGDIDREQLRALALEVASSAPGTVAERIRAIFAWD